MSNTPAFRVEYQVQLQQIDILRHQNFSFYTGVGVFEFDFEFVGDHGLSFFKMIITSCNMTISVKLYAGFRLRKFVLAYTQMIESL